MRPLRGVREVQRRLGERNVARRERVNYVRSVGGLPPVEERQDYRNWMTADLSSHPNLQQHMARIIERQMSAYSFAMSGRQSGYLTFEEIQEQISTRVTESVQNFVGVSRPGRHYSLVDEYMGFDSCDSYDSSMVAEIVQRNWDNDQFKYLTGDITEQEYNRRKKLKQMDIDRANNKDFKFLLDKEH